MQATEKSTITPSKRRRSGSVKRLKVKLWHSIERLSNVVEYAESDTVRTKAASALSSLAGAWVKANENDELEARITRLEQREGETW